jgi:hypothetical protein
MIWRSPRTLHSCEKFKAIGRREEDTIFRTNNGDKLVLVVRTQSLHDSFTRTTTNVGILTDEEK